MSESFLSTLKLDPMDRRWWAISARARRGIFEYIEAFYDRAGCTPLPGCLSPVVYEAGRIAHRKAADTA